MYGIMVSVHCLFCVPPIQMFGSMDDLLRKMPVVRSTAGVSRSELHRRWQEWRSECCRRRDAGVFAARPHLHMLARVRTMAVVLVD